MYYAWKRIHLLLISFIFRSSSSFLKTGGSWIREDEVKASNDGYIQSCPCARHEGVWRWEGRDYLFFFTLTLDGTMLYFLQNIEEINSEIPRLSSPRLNYCKAFETYIRIRINGCSFPKRQVRTAEKTGCSPVCRNGASLRFPGRSKVSFIWTHSA